MSLAGGGTTPRAPKLLVQVRRAIRVRHYSRRTEEAYVQWIRRFVRFHGLKHPVELGEAEVARFLSHLAEEGAVAAATQNQAASALQFLYQEVLRRPFARPERVVRARESVRLPVVLTPAEVKAVLAQLRGVPRLVASLLYGSGLRLLEALELRVKDVDFARREIVVRQGKGRKDRVTMLPVSVRELADEHLRRVQRLHRDDLARGLGAGAGAGAVELPDAFGVKVPSARRAAGGGGVGDREASELSHVSPLVRHASIGGRLRHPHGAGVVGPPGRADDDDLHACVEPWRSRGPEPSGLPVTGIRSRAA